MYKKERELESQQDGLLGSDVAYISQGVTVEGTIRANGKIIIDGAVKGTVKAGSEVTIGVTGRIDGKVIAKNATIEGHAAHSVTATEKLRLGTNSVVRGEIKTARLVVEDGAVFHAKCAMPQNGAAYVPAAVAGTDAELEESADVVDTLPSSD